MELTDRERALIAECVILVSKQNGVQPDMMKELLAIAEKMKVEEKADKKE